MEKKFLPIFSRHEPSVMDSTALTTFMMCPRKYFFRMVLGFAPKTTEQYFVFGGAYHKFREILETEFASGKSPVESYQAATNAAQHYFERHGGNPKPKTRYDFLTSERLDKSMIAAFQHWLKEKKEDRIKVIATEQPFLLEMDDGTTIAGRADQIIEWNGAVWGRDFKTSSKTGPFYNRTLEPNDQFTRYTWAESKLTGRRVKGQIIEVMFNDKKNGPKIEVLTSSRTEWQLKQWEQDHKFWMKLIQMCRENDEWPMNTKSCAFCEFRDVCVAPSVNAMASQLKSYFAVRPWDCTKVDQDD